VPVVVASHRALPRGRAGEQQARADEATDATARIGALSPRETEVLLGLVAGQANKVFVFDLNVSTRTVEFHRANLMQKRQVGSLSEVVRLPPGREPVASSRGGGVTGQMTRGVSR
jgi:two-component system response regulator FixJ